MHSRRDLVDVVRTVRKDYPVAVQAATTSTAATTEQKEDMAVAGSSLSSSSVSLHPLPLLHLHDDPDDSTISNHPTTHDSKNIIHVETMGDIETVDGVFRKAAVVVVCVWALLVTWTLCVTTTVTAAPFDAEEDRLERAVPKTAFLILLVSAALQMTPTVLSRIRSTSSSSSHHHQHHHKSNNNIDVDSDNNNEWSGILIAAIVIQIIALITNGLLGWGPRAVVLDPIIGTRVFLFRWCEWIPLSGFMTLLAESTDLPNSTSNNGRAHVNSKRNNDNSNINVWRYPLMFSACQSVSTFCGIVLPFCQSLLSWSIVMTISCVTFVMIFPRVMARRRVFHQLQAQQRDRGSTCTVLERECQDRRKFAYYLMLMCSICWSTLVVLYTITMVAHMALPATHWLRFPSLAMSCDCVADVIAKVSCFQWRRRL